MGNSLQIQLKPNGSAALTSAVLADPQQLNLLFASCVPQLRRAALRMADNREDSEDALQDALCLGFRNIHQFRGTAKFSTWLYSILVNSVRAIRRKRVSRPATVPIDGEILMDNSSAQLEINSPAPDPEEEYSQNEQDRMICRLVFELPPLYREAVWLRGVEGLEMAEIADRLGICLSTAKVRVARGFRLIGKIARNPRVSTPTLQRMSR